MSDLLKEVGAFAGLAAFLGLAVLALLYFAQARDVRRLRENASFLIEGDDAAPITSAAPAEAAERTAAAVAAAEPEEAAASAAATAPNDREAFRRAELARQAAERRQRFEQRRRGGRPSFGGGPGEPRQRPSWLSEPRSVAAIVVGAVLLVAGIAFGATRLLGGDEETTASKGGKQGSACPPANTNVAVLNGTASSGLAAQFAAPLKQQGYKTSPVTNTESPVATSVVMFAPGAGEPCAPVISQIVGIQKQAPVNQEIAGIDEGAPVAVVLGDDVAGGTSTGETSTGASSTTTTGF
jgi:hypothetical protein